ncbi:MAG: hypothetical protein JW807_16805 [Spirochaetes bacterium]|nr:hypothetical protein [Spirochaetota bacterium]
MIDKFRITIRRFKIDFEVPLVWFTYFPFVGWMYPFLFKKDDTFAMHHGKQSLVLSILFTAIPVVLTFSAVFIPISLRAIRLAFAIAVYCSHLAYFSVCGWGFFKIMENVRYDFPVIARYAKKIEV